jgi:3-dehydroquinate synthase
MEVLLMSDSFIVKSSIQDYEVNIVDSLIKNIASVYKPGDYIIADENVVNLHPELKTLLSEYKGVIMIEALEKTKSYEGVIPFIEELISNGFKRNNRLIAIGGGITQDVTAFMASILYRGVGWIFFPTTLLAQADSCIGSKTSINFRKFKNQVGNFYPPLSIYIDPGYLKTLQERDIRSGVGEMAHYYYVSGHEDVSYFEKRFQTAIDDQSNFSELIKKSLSIKKSYIEIDEFDKNERIVFNYGHTFGHAIESITNYGIPHGVAVSFGMDMANYISWKKGYISLNELQEARKVFQSIWEGYSINDIHLDDLLKAMEKDKKNEDGKFGLILTKGWGKMFKDLTEPDETFISWMNEYLNNYHN